jgi:hypothetical protein
MLAAVAGMSVASLALATPCTTDVLLGSANLGNSGDGTELAAMEAAAGGITLTMDSKVESNIGATLCPGTTDKYYINISDSPGYFLLKFGIGGTNATSDTFFFQNIDDLMQLVFTSSQVQCLSGGPNCADNENIGRLSHYTTYNGGASVPEPATLALILVGALGIAYVRRRVSRRGH